MSRLKSSLNAPSKYTSSKVFSASHVTSKEWSAPSSMFPLVTLACTGPASEWLFWLLLSMPMWSYVGSPGSPFWYVSISMQTEGLNGPPTYAMSPPLFPTVKGPVPAWCKTKHIPSAPAGSAPKFTSKENAKSCSRSKAHSFHAALVSLATFSVMFTQSGLPTASVCQASPTRTHCAFATLPPHTPTNPKRVIAWAKTAQVESRSKHGGETREQTPDRVRPHAGCRNFSASNQCSEQRLGPSCPWHTNSKALSGCVVHRVAVGSAVHGLGGNVSIVHT